MPPPFLLHTTYADTCIVTYFKAKTNVKDERTASLVQPDTRLSL